MNRLFLNHAIILRRTVTCLISGPRLVTDNHGTSVHVTVVSLAYGLATTRGYTIV